MNKVWISGQVPKPSFGKYNAILRKKMMVTGLQIHLKEKKKHESMP